MAAPVHIPTQKVLSSLDTNSLNAYGQLGLGHTSYPVEMGDDLVDADLGADFFATQLVSGNLYNCALSSGFEVKCWGR